jgi:hypothetical protein
VYFTEGRPLRSPDQGRDALEPVAWAPYKLWVGDLWKCPSCGAEILIGMARQPIDEHFTPTFAERERTLNPAGLRIDDC